MVGASLAAVTLPECDGDSAVINSHSVTAGASRLTDDTTPTRQFKAREQLARVADGQIPCSLRGHDRRRLRRRRFLGGAVVLFADGFSGALALDAREHGIAVSALHPGNVPTNIWGDLVDQVRETEGMVPLEDIGQAALSMVTMAPGTNVLSSVILPLSQPYLGRG